MWCLTNKLAMLTLIWQAAAFWWREEIQFWCWLGLLYLVTSQLDATTRLPSQKHRAELVWWRHARPVWIRHWLVWSESENFLPAPVGRHLVCSGLTGCVVVQFRKASVVSYEVLPLQWSNLTIMLPSDTQGLRANAKFRPWLLYAHSS